MDVLTVTIFVSLVLVVTGVGLFIWRLRGGDFEHGDRLSLLPLNDDDGVDRGPAEPTPDKDDDKESEDRDR